MKMTRIAWTLALAGATPLALAQEQDSKNQAAAESPAEPTIAKVVQDGATFSILETALQSTGLTETLAAKGPYTVFAPTDEAFAKLGEEAMAQLFMPENREQLRSILLFHVVPGQMLSSDFTEGELTTANGEKVKVDLDDEQLELDDSMVVTKDVLTSNGVIHVLDKVLIPDSVDEADKVDVDAE